tara:strand:- start:1003 stop:1968 length:966 start_codon:yes stop_codon:yes gene_type:complete
MKISKIIIVLGEPQSTFSEILFKYFKSKKFSKNKKKVVLIGNVNLLLKQMKKLNYKLNLNIIDKVKDAKVKNINIININYKSRETFAKISSYSSKYIAECFKKGLNLIKNNKNIALINGPISKKYFLKKKYLGVTEYISKKTKSKGQVMLIYNDKLSVSPLTTHLPLKNVSKNITKKKIILNVNQINKFYKNSLNKKPNIAVLGLNPHCESIDKFSEEKKIIIPAIKNLKKNNLNVDGPFPADTFFLKKNIDKYNAVVGMYHDQVLTPIKTLYKFNAINITLGLPFIRISPDHGPNNNMIGKNKSDPSSIFYAMKFIDKIR